MDEEDFRTKIQKGEGEEIEGYEVPALVMTEKDQCPNCNASGFTIQEISDHNRPKDLPADVLGNSVCRVCNADFLVK